MKVLTLDLNGKTYTSTRVTAWISKEAMRINKDLVSMSKAGKDAQDASENLDLIENMFEKMGEVTDRSVNLICEVYGNKFTADEVLKSLTDEEIRDQINKLIFGVMGVVEKN